MATLRTPGQVSAVAGDERAAGAATELNLRLLMWSGPVGIALVIGGLMGLAGFLPPPSPRLAGADAAAVWQHHTVLKQAGMIMCFWGGTLYIPFTMAIGYVLRRAGSERIMPMVQTVLGVFGTVYFSMNFLILAIAAFRSSQPPESIQPLHDLGFILTFSPAAPFTLQYLAIGVAILQARGARRAIPRWVAYANFWVGLLLVPATFIPFFTSGPLAWNGILGFWVPAIVFITWYGVMFWAMRDVTRGGRRAAA